jgi:hypothetical protein
MLKCWATLPREIQGMLRRDARAAGYITGQALRQAEIDAKALRGEYEDVEADTTRSDFA